MSNNIKNLIISIISISVISICIFNYKFIPVEMIRFHDPIGLALSIFSLGWLIIAFFVFIRSINSIIGQIVFKNIPNDYEINDNFQFLLAITTFGLFIYMTSYVYNKEELNENQYIKVIKIMKSSKAAKEYYKKMDNYKPIRIKDFVEMYRLKMKDNDYKKRLKEKKHNKIQKMINDELKNIHESV